MIDYIAAATYALWQIKHGNQDIRSQQRRNGYRKPALTDASKFSNC
jgi:hypothetical protein